MRHMPRDLIYMRRSHVTAREHNKATSDAARTACDRRIAADSVQRGTTSDSLASSSILRVKCSDQRTLQRQAAIEQRAAIEHERREMQ